MKRKLLERSTGIEDLPTEVFVEVIKFLKISELGNITVLNKNFSEIVRVRLNQLKEIDSRELHIMYSKEFRALFRKCISVEKAVIEMFQLSPFDLKSLPLSLTHISLISFRYFEENYLKELSYLKNLKYIKLELEQKILSETIEINQKTWEKFILLPKLEELHISSGLTIIIENPIINTNIKHVQYHDPHFCSPSSLRTLKLISHQNSSGRLTLNDESIHTLTNKFPHLTRFSFTDYNIEERNLSNEGLLQISNTWPYLKTLKLSKFASRGLSSDNSELGLMMIANTCKELENLSLNSFKVLTDASVIEFINNCRLKKLELGFTNITDDSLHAISLSTSIKSLSLRGCRRVSERGLIEIAQGLDLKELNLSTTAEVTDKALASVCENEKNLKKLILNEAKVTWKSFCRISELESLEKLSVLHCSGIGGEDYRFVGDLRNLKELAINGMGNFFSEDIRYIVRRVGSKLLKLNLNYCANFDKECFIEIVENCKKLRKLYLKEFELFLSGITEEELGKLRSLMVLVQSGYCLTS